MKHRRTMSMDGILLRFAGTTNQPLAEAVRLFGGGFNEFTKLKLILDGKGSEIPEWEQPRLQRLYMETDVYFDICGELEKPAPDIRHLIHLSTGLEELELLSGYALSVVLETGERPTVELYNRTIRRLQMGDA